MALTSFLKVNGVNFPCPRDGFNYIISTVVDAGRNVNGQVVGQRIGRDLYKFDQMEWVGLYPEVWRQMLAAVEPFYIPVTFEDIRTGGEITITMYPGDREAQPLFVNPRTHLVERYHTCKFNLIDTGR